jgi:hypothetical protein
MDITNGVVECNILTDQINGLKYVSIAIEDFDGELVLPPVVLDEEAVIELMDFLNGYLEELYAD